MPEILALGKYEQEVFSSNVGKRPCLKKGLWGRWWADSFDNFTQSIITWEEINLIRLLCETDSHRDIVLII